MIFPTSDNIYYIKGATLSLRVIIAVLLCSIPALCQQQFSYVATTGNVALVTAATSATLQIPATNGLPIIFAPVPGVGASVYCSVVCTATILLNTVSASAATATAGSVKPVFPNSPTAVVNFYTASNVSGGTTLYLANIPAGTTYNFDLSQFKLGASNTGITITTSSITGNANITFFPVEIH